MAVTSEYFFRLKKRFMLMMQNEFLKYFSQKPQCEKSVKISYTFVPSDCSGPALTSYSYFTKWVIEISSISISSSGGNLARQLSSKTENILGNEWLSFFAQLNIQQLHGEYFSQYCTFSSQEPTMVGKYQAKITKSYSRYYIFLALLSADFPLALYWQLKKNLTSGAFH